MADKVNTLSTRAKTDPWAEAFEQMGTKHRMLPVDNLVPLDDILAAYPKKKEYAIQTFVRGDQTVRVLQLIDKYDRVIMQWDNLELVDGKLFMRMPYRPRVSWFSWFFGGFFAPQRVQRGPVVNVNVRR
jgi:hypothetical protein